MLRWRVFEDKNIADILVEVYGKNKKELFLNIVKMFSSIISDIKKIKENREWKIEVKEDKFSDLVFSFIDKLIFLKDTKGLLFKDGDFKIKQNDNKIKQNDKLLLTALLKGAKVTKDLPIKIDIKALTRHKFKIEKNKYYKVIMVFDV